MPTPLPPSLSLTEVLANHIHSCVIGTSESLLDLEFYQRLARSGADITAVGPQTPMGKLLIRYEDYSDDRRGRVASWLISEGANPLLFDQFAEIIPFTPGYFFGQVVRGIAEKELDGQGLRDAEGQNLFHILAKKKPSLFLSAQTITKETSSKLWFGQGRDEDGATPLHIMFSEVLSVLGEGPGLPASYLRGETEIVFTILAEAVIKGYSLNQTDNNGNTVQDLLHKCLEAGLNKYEAYGKMSWVEGVAKLEQYEMERNTPQVSGNKSKALRL